MPHRVHITTAAPRTQERKRQAAQQEAEAVLRDLQQEEQRSGEEGVEADMQGGARMTGAEGGDVSCGRQGSRARAHGCARWAAGEGETEKPGGAG